MFEGETTIKFSKEAALLIMSRNMSDMFGMPLEVTGLDQTYSGLEVTFSTPQGQDKKNPEETPVEESEAKDNETK